jgi:hypothetical protein
VRTWSTATWADFVGAAEGFRDSLSPRGREDVAYFRCLELMRADGSMLARAEHGEELVRFLNAWRCRLDSRGGPAAFAGWIRDHAAQLEALDGIQIADPRVPRIAAGADAVYESLFELRPLLRNLGDAAASKALHQLLPELVVMWDRAVRGWATAQGCAGYGDFLVAMHELAVRLLAEANLDVAQAQEHLAERLGYPQRKPLARTLDEANIHWVANLNSS